MKGVILVKISRPCLESGFGFLSSRPRASTQQDWSTLEKSMSCVLGTKDEALKLSADDSQHFHWHTDASLGVHANVRSHAGGVFSMVFGSMSSSLTKKK